MEEQAKCAWQTSVGSPTVARESSLKWCRNFWTKIRDMDGRR